MSEASGKPEAQEEAREVAKTRAAIPERIYIVAYPNVVFLYPTLIVTVVAGIWMTILERGGNAAEGSMAVTLAAVFLGTLAINMFVLTVDFPRATSLTLFFVIATVGLVVALLAIQKPDFLPFLAGLVNGVRPVANATFYWVVAAIMVVVFVIVKIKIQFDYWEVRRNEILHHHGFLSDLRRYPTSGLQIEKEINDVFEYLLMRSGRLILKPPGQNRAFVLDNVPFINSKEEKLTQMLSAIKVKVHTEED